MSDPPLVEQAGYWEAHYREGNTGWDLGGPAPPFVDLLTGPDAPPPGRLIALGCGRGHDAILFAQAGFDVIGIDFAPSAVAAARARAARAGVPVRFEQHDLFVLPAVWDGTFDYVLEHTCVSALPPARLPAYVEVVHRLLAPTGRYLALFFTHGQPGGPPFGITPAEIRRLFTPRFVINYLGPPARSMPRREGRETLALMRPRHQFLR
jgi:SAM-dependent methyltransferase